MRRLTAFLITCCIICSLSFNCFAASSGIETFVNSLYADCLGRTADGAGFNDWCTRLSNGSITGKEAAYGFFFSPEFQLKANSMSDNDLIQTYYKVFLNRTADSSGLNYWKTQIAGTDNDLGVLFIGFADSAEFASKCQSYGIATGGTVEIPVTHRTAQIECISGSTDDSVYTAQGYEVFYVNLGNNTSMKVYARFVDVTEHMNRVNSYRAENGLGAYSLLTRQADPRVQYARQRAVEIAFSANHTAPMFQPNGTDTRAPANFSENMTYGALDPMGSFEWFRNSSGHNRNMLRSLSERQILTCACCECLFVLPDGTVTSDSPAASMGFTPGYNDALVQCYWPDINGMLH